jgi:hypothetical protein
MLYVHAMQCVRHSGVLNSTALDDIVVFGCVCHRTRVCSKHTMLLDVALLLWSFNEVAQPTRCCTVQAVYGAVN